MTTSDPRCAALSMSFVVGILLAVDTPAPPAASFAIPPDCQEWTNGCRVCLRAADGTIVCSTPGIACQPAAVTCRRPNQP